jgi:hypothetical protein
MKRGILDVVHDSVSLSDMMIAERHGNDGSPRIAAGAGLEQRRRNLRLTLGSEAHSLSKPINLEGIEAGRDLVHSYALTISTPMQLTTGTYLDMQTFSPTRIFSRRRSPIPWIWNYFQAAVSRTGPNHVAQSFRDPESQHGGPVQDYR